MTLNVQNVHRWLTHIPAVACDILSRRCQWFSPVTQTKLTTVHLILGNWFWLLLQFLLRLQHCPQIW